MKFPLILSVSLIATPAMASDHSERCITLERAKKEVASESHAVWTTLTNEQFQFLRGVSATHPQTPVGIPLGDRAAMVMSKGEKTALIFFIDGEKACDMFVIPDAMIKMVMDIGTGVVKHEGDGT